MDCFAIAYWFVWIKKIDVQKKIPTRIYAQFVRAALVNAIFVSAGEIQSNKNWEEKFLLIIWKISKRNARQQQSTTLYKEKLPLNLLRKLFPLDYYSKSIQIYDPIAGVYEHKTFLFCLAFDIHFYIELTWNVMDPCIDWWIIAFNKLSADSNLYALTGQKALKILFYKMFIWATFVFIIFAFQILNN